MVSEAKFLPFAQMLASDVRFLSLFSRTVTRIPAETRPVKSLEAVATEESGEVKGLVGLTRWRTGKQVVTFYRDLFDELSDGAAIAVIAHELAHAWLNEHVGPEESKSREREADGLARSWGFGEELSQLDAEAESIGGSAY